MQKPRVSLSIGGVWRSGLILLMVALVTGCAGPALEDYRDARPQLVPDEFFRGELSARGVVKDFSGEVIRTFDADIQASWDENGVGTLDEVFRFSDGEVQTRVWTLEPEGNSYHATAGDVVEPGTMRWQGNAIHMNYVLRVPYNDGTLDVRMDDWMYLVTPDTLINQTTMSKWGIDVGEVVLVIQKHEGREQPAQDR
ncbi:Protein of unknown function [Marinobacter persicus]|uniref:Lipoprotein n=2 Tax=Marinobacter persicus TaxID=930118 RepID=A0A1I3V017_9GAMM|nr:DUF3833 domain-containing protein [Marinobacter persicus]GHD41952.1 hypothetical protein GCM10008110_04710 [Marinobacter persicus]SFJ88299.1 Protein of unknown function [Marinobacter persicus]